MPSLSAPYDVVIVGAGLSGLTAAYFLKKTQPTLNILIIERSGTAGGLTGNWIDHRLGPKKKLQYPMHIIFRDKYPNLLSLVHEIGGEVSELYRGYNIITSDKKIHRLEMNDWASRNLPPPLHGLGMIAKLKFPLSAKWDLFKLAAVSAYCASELITGRDEPRHIPNTMSLESLELLLGVGAVTRDFIETVTPSIYNLHPWYTSAPRMASVIAGTLLLNPNSLHHHVFAKNYNAAFIDRFVARLESMGVRFQFWTELRRIDASLDGKKVEAIWIKPYGPEASGSHRTICQNCGAENYVLDRAFCTRCGTDTTLNHIASGALQKPVSSELWKVNGENDCQRLSVKTLFTAMYPHMIAKVIPEDSPFLKDAFVRSFYSSRGNQTELSIARVYYDRPVTAEKFITGTHNPTFVFNGCQSVFNNFGGNDLDHEGDVIDVLLDIGVIQNGSPRQEIVNCIIRDLEKVYPEANHQKVSAVSFARIHSSVLYLSEQPAIVGLHRFFNRHRTAAKNWYVMGCHSGKIGIGMESAVESAKTAVNQFLEDAGEEESVQFHVGGANGGPPNRARASEHGGGNSRQDPHETESLREKASVPIAPYRIHAGGKAAAKLGQAILFWKRRGRTWERRSQP